MAVEFDGIEYHIGCTSVEPEHLGSVLARGRDVNLRYTMKSIRTVDVADAVAVSMLHHQTGTYDDGGSNDCGRWWLSANADLPDDRFKEIALRVADAQPGDFV